MPTSPLPSDFILDAAHQDFAITGLQVSSVVRLHQIITVRLEVIVRELGDLPADLDIEVEARLQRLFGLPT